MRYTPYGYSIIRGRAVINKKEAEVIKQICNNYLSGMSMKIAAENAGVNMTHSRVKRLIQNKRYLGDDFYPQILTEELVNAFEEERIKREKNYSGIRYRKNIEIEIPIKFKLSKVDIKYNDPIKQVEYAYSLIESVV